MPGPRHRWFSAVGYALMACAGVAAIYWPAPSVRSATSGVDQLLYLWDAFLVAGGLLSLFGAVTDRWVGELLGLPLLAAVFAVYGLSAFLAAYASGRPMSVAGGCALTSVALILVGRWRELGVVRRSAVKAVNGG